MPLFSLPKSTRGQVAMAAAHVAMLGLALGLAWRQDGPPPEKAFWAIVIYFAEIAVAGVLEMAVAAFRREE